MTDTTIFSILSEAEFEAKALEIFRFQCENVEVYKRFCNLLKVEKRNVQSIRQIPFLPIQFFKSEKIMAKGKVEETLFTSSGTTGSTTSKHYVSNLALYEKSFLKGFENFYGDPSKYTILALLPSYLEREGSSLIYMVEKLINASKKEKSGFYLNDLDTLISTLLTLEEEGEKVLLLGVSFALLNLIEKHSFQLKNTIVMETGGMKGRREEMVREELQSILKKGFGIDKVHSEYGMTELLSQAYSKGNGVFECPPWMKVLTRDTENPLSYVEEKTGGLNIIDLANQHSCAFIATQDLGKTFKNNTFEVLGRFDSSDIRGCNLMVL